TNTAYRNQDHGAQKQPKNHEHAGSAASKPAEQIIPPGMPTAAATLTQKRPKTPLSSVLKKGLPLLLKAAKAGLAQPHAQARGRIVGARRPIKRPSSLALAPTLRGAALHQKRRQSEYGSQGQRLWLERWDLFEPVHQQKQGVLILFVVDASGSMAARKRMAASKGAVLALLQRAYQQRNQVGLLQFRGARATLLLPPTHSTSRAIQALTDLPTGGRTPLASGLRLALQTLQVARMRDGHLQTMLVLVTDGRANVTDLAPGGSVRDPLEDALAAAHELRLAGMPALVIDTEEGIRMGLARTLAQALDGTYIELAQLEAAPVANAVRTALNGARWGNGDKKR
ncbi:MAG: VWA domain-containing protein, partial [Ktedonobacteraceae bacterium]|nr:VWA domain-containing protein [Ktedonobacteraceae bacterium]